MNRQPGRIGLYLVLIVMLVAGYFYLNNQVASQSNYTMDKLEQAAQDGRVTSADSVSEQRGTDGICCGRDRRRRTEKGYM